MRIKATWKPVGHSAQKWRESTHRRGAYSNVTRAGRAEPRSRDKKKPFG